LAQGEFFNLRNRFKLMTIFGLKMGRLGLALLKQESLNLLEDGQACGLRAVEATCGDHIGLQLQAFLIRIA
jgi:hypothetical protein